MIVLTSVCRFYPFKTTTLVNIPVITYLNVVFEIRRFHTQVKGPQGHQCSQLDLHWHPKVHQKGSLQRRKMRGDMGIRVGDGPCSIK